MADHHRPPGGEKVTPLPPETNTLPQKTYATTLNPHAYAPRETWFRLQPIPLAKRNLMTKDNKPMVFVSDMEIEQAIKQFEFALVMKFTSGRPSLHDIKNHINASWKLSKEPVLSLVDARHVFMILATKEDMVRAQTQVSHKINSSLFRIFRWHKDFDYKKDSPCVPVWISLPKLPIPFINPSVLESIGNSIGRFLRIDERTMAMTQTMATKICVEVDLSKEFLDKVWIGSSVEKGFWQPIHYEGNVSFCDNCGLLGHVKGVCRKGRSIAQKENLPKHILQRPKPLEESKPSEENKGDDLVANKKVTQAHKNGKNDQ
ncbi:hypothetical protein CASFOL_017932 [Castilleja foliolosa]|uniref:DUF4283 domain-containing protein n=1 Tax=Castilleja foliolosa TaxID=1961234 RepID=A0ABD3DC77_9LAMI